jgi:hypothetical protein
MTFHWTAASRNRLLAIVCALFSLAIAGNEIPLSAQQTVITELKVQSLATPLAVEDKNPLISWRMSSPMATDSLANQETSCGRDRPEKWGRH